MKLSSLKPDSVYISTTLVVSSMYHIKSPTPECCLITESLSWNEGFCHTVIFYEQEGLDHKSNINYGNSLEIKSAISNFRGFVFAKLLIMNW